MQVETGEVISILHVEGKSHLPCPHLFLMIILFRLAVDDARLVDRDLSLPGGTQSDYLFHQAHPVPVLFSSFLFLLVFPVVAHCFFLLTLFSSFSILPL